MVKKTKDFQDSMSESGSPDEDDVGTVPQPSSLPKETPNFQDDQSESGDTGAKRSKYKIIATGKVVELTDGEAERDMANGVGLERI